MTLAARPGAAQIAPLRGGQTLYALLGLLLLWPGLIHGEVYGFNDTVSYMRGIDTVLAKFTGYGAPFFAGHEGPGGAGAAEAGEKMVLYGRSLYFGAFVYLGLLCGTFWVPAILQALVAGWAVVAVVRHFVDPADRARFRAACLTAFAMLACTPLPFFVCFLMPDLAVGLALPAAAVLLAGWQRERRAWRLGLLALLVFAALAHSTAVAVLALLGLGGLAAATVSRSKGAALAAGALLAAAVAGLAGEAAFGLATRATTGTEPVRPPFLTARLIEDGPARRFLAERCAEADFVLCRHPIEGHVTAEIFLWSPDRPEGGFKALPVPDAKRVAAEQGRFAIAVARAYPAETAMALAKDLLVLVADMRLSDFRPEFLASQMRADRQFERISDDIPLPLPQRIITGLTMVLALGGLGVLLASIRWPLPPGPRAIAWIVLGAILANDAICAWLSGPFSRYGTRVIWALPLVAVLLLFNRALRAGSTARIGR